MLIDLTCPAEVFETTLPTEEIPAVGLSLYNLSDRVIVSAEVTLKLLSGSGAEKERVVYRARALNGRPHSTFRMNVPCPHHASARSADVTIDKVWFSDNDVWRRELSASVEYTPNALPVSRALTNLKFTAGETAVGFPSQQDGLWVCVCGRPNPDSEEYCARCRRQKELIFTRYNRETVDQQVFQRERQLDLATRNVREDTTRMQRIREEEFNRAEARRARRKFLAWCLPLCAAVTAAMLFAVAPALRMLSVNRAMADGNWTAARETCEALGSFPGAREKAAAGRLRFGTVDSWLVWQLTKGTVHVTDVSNASRTMLFNINTLEWDQELLDLLGVPLSMMPRVCSSSEVYGKTKTTIFAHAVPIAGIAGDQQAALFGQMCTTPGSVKNTYGTGCFLLMNTGEKPILSKNNLLTTVAWKIGDKVNYALEGSIFVGGSAVQWLRDGLGVIRSSAEIEALAASVPDNGGVYFVPAMTGLGAPYWDQYAHGVICGITRGVTAAHIARATLEGIAFQTMDIVGAMERDAGVRLAELKVDGGASRNNLMMQFQADILGTAVIRPQITETTAMGACYLAGLAVGYWGSLGEIRAQWQAERTFVPSDTNMDPLKQGWKDAISRTLTR